MTINNETESTSNADAYRAMYRGMPAEYRAKHREAVDQLRSAMGTATRLAFEYDLPYVINDDARADLQVIHEELGGRSL